MFRLTLEEWTAMRSQIVTASQSVESPGYIRVYSDQQKRNTSVLPYAFTEQGVAMLSGVLRSEKAISMNIAIMRAFVAVRKAMALQSDLKEQLKEIRERVGEHDVQLNQIYDALENLADEKAAKRKWEDRERIGFKK
jgi:DNA-binding PadR family transcriptional regulator